MTTKSSDGAEPPFATPWLLRWANQRYRSAMADAIRVGGFGDLSQPGYWAIGAIASGALDASDLVDRMGISKQAVSKLIDALVLADYLVREVNESDRRRTNLVLTNRGSKASRIITRAVAKTDDVLAAELGKDGLNELRRLLRQVSRTR